MPLYVRCFAALAVLAATWLLLPAQAAQAIATRIDAITLDAPGQRLVLRYRGAAPRFTRHGFDGERRIYLDFSDTTTVTRHGTGAAGELLTRWGLAQHARGRARLALSFRLPAAVSVDPDAGPGELVLRYAARGAESRGDLEPLAPATPTPWLTPARPRGTPMPEAELPLLVPEPSTSIPRPTPTAGEPALEMRPLSPTRTPAPSPTPAEPQESVLGTPYYDAKIGAVAVPFSGPTPEYAVTRSGREFTIQIDFKARPGLDTPYSANISNHPHFLRWQFLPAEARLFIRLRDWTAVTVTVDAARRRMLVAPAGSPPSSSASPPVVAPPTDPGHIRIGDGAARGSGRVKRVEDNGVRGSFAFVDFAERYPRGSVDTSVTGVPVLAAGLTLGRGDWSGDAALSWNTYAFEDVNLPLSLHTRQDWRFEAWGGRRIEGYGMLATLGAGYMLRWESASHTGAPPTPTYAFSNFRLLHGPLVAGRYVTRLDPLLGWLGDAGRDWQLAIDGGLVPFVLSSIDPGVSPLPTLLATRAQARLERGLGPLWLGVGYRRWDTFGADYSESVGGPFAEVTVVFW